MPTPGAATAFKAKPAPATGIKPQQIGGVKFPGKIDPSKIGSAAPQLKISALGNPALGAMFGLLFGRVANAVPGLRNMLSNPALRDAAIGAAIGTMLDEQHEQQSPNPYNPRPSPPQAHGWNLQ